MGRILSTAALALILCFSSVSAIANLPPSVANVQYFGNLTDDGFNDWIRWDGGGGGYVNGYNFIVSSDAETTNSIDVVTGGSTSFVHNTISYFGVRDAADPSRAIVFGARQPESSSEFVSSLVGPAQENETYAEASFAIWSASNWIPAHDPALALGVMNCVNESSQAVSTGDYPLYYSTLVLINIIDPDSVRDGEQPASTRPVPQLFYPGETLYGSFSLFTGPNGYLYLIGTSQQLGGQTTGLTVAKVPMGYAHDRSQYTYWDGSTYTSTMPTMGDQSANIFSFTDPQFDQGPGTGDVFYSEFFQTIVCVFMTNDVAGIFWITWSESGAVEGPWATPQELLATPTDDSCTTSSKWNYAGHAYPGWDASGQSLLLSWSACNEYIQMAQVYWN